MSNLLKEAIADAKAVRATALANAKAALEEAFQPKLEAMLAEKLKSEINELESSNISNPDPTGSNSDKDETGEHPLRIDRYVDEGEMEITDEELNEILAELEGELEEGSQVDPNVPVAPAPAPAPVDAAAAPAPAPVAPTPVDAALVAPAPAPVDPTAQAPTPAPVAEGESEDEIVDLQELLDSLNEEEITEGEEVDESIVNEEEEKEEDKEEKEEKVDEKIEDEKVDESLETQLNEAM